MGEHSPQVTGCFRAGTLARALSVSYRLHSTPGVGRVGRL